MVSSVNGVKVTVLDEGLVQQEKERLARVVVSKNKEAAKKKLAEEKKKLEEIRKQ